MTRLSQPLLFLAAVVGTWSVSRVIALAPPWMPEEHVQQPPGGDPLSPSGQEQQQAASGPALPAIPASRGPPPIVLASSHQRPWATLPQVRRLSLRPVAALPAHLRASAAHLPPSAPSFTPGFSTGSGAPQSPTLPLLPALSVERGAPSAPRLAASAWLLLRNDIAATGLAPGGSLGGSQAGLRLTYRLNGENRRPLALSARLYVPLARPSGTEAAVGLDWRPLAELPLHLLAERREAIGREGRSDFSLTLYGGVDRSIARGRLRLQAYGQAGVVGARDPDLFADGAARLTTRIGPIDVGAGAWAGAQPGVERVDVGPHVSTRIPVGKSAITIAADWRFRIAGDAAPASGPALTIATDF